MLGWKIATIIFGWLFITALMIIVKLILAVGKILEPAATLKIRADSEGEVDAKFIFEKSLDSLSERKGFWVAVDTVEETIIEWTPPEE